MKRLFLIALFSFLVKLVVGQSAISKTDCYYANVVKAEDFLLQTKYDSALSYYKRAFIVNGFPFRNDLFNATSVCRVIGDSLQYKEFN